MEKLAFELIGGSDSRVYDAISLGDRARKTVGLMPREAYVEAARKRRLLVALVGAEVVGYALYGLPRNEVTLAHLVVAEEHRKAGVARALVEEISRLYPQRSGIRANCRKDYGLAPMWTSLGFHPRLETEGRGAAKSTIVVWYRNNPDHVDLLTPSEPPILWAAIDFNILRDLHDRPEREGARESRSLVEDHLADKLRLVVTPELYQEVGAVQNDHERNRCLAAMSSGYSSMQGDRRRVDELTSEWIGAVAAVQPSYPATAQDREDARHLGEAAACGAEVFVTRDEALIRLASGSAEATLGIRVLRPADLIIRIDELTRPDVYRPADLHGTGYSRNAVTTQSEQELIAFQNIADQETKRDFLAVLRTAAAELPRWDRTLVRDPQGRPVLLCVSGIQGERLEVPLLRVDARHPVGGTLVQQTLFELRNRCREQQLEVLAITDQHPAAPVRRAAVMDGFAATSEALVCLVVDRAGAAAQVQATTEHAATAAGLQLDLAMRPEMSVFAAAEVERTFWPAKITDSQLPTWILPIQPRWSVGLLGVPTTLPLFRTEEWGLGPEHVYYRSPAGPRLRAPARLLWYKSQGKGKERGEAAVIGSSLLEEVIVDTPDALHTRFSRLGVWTLNDITRASRQGNAQALRFTHTEIFGNFLSGKKLRKIFTEGGFSGTVQGPRSINSKLFTSIYLEGTHAGRAT
jgi:GNAT superfamily N-acetyltransferase/predicted nucleic acid-binding protein